MTTRICSAPGHCLARTSNRSRSGKASLNAGAAQVTVVKGSNVESAFPGGIDAAVAAANAADVVLLAIGEGEHMSGEAQSRTQSSCPNPNRGWPRQWQRRASP